jgi:NTP pyrophosphatase (non-canonical NTP hydrolase)
LCLASGASVAEIRTAVAAAVPPEAAGDPGYTAPDPDKVGEELADVSIILMYIAEMKGLDLSAEIDFKMGKNRHRVWHARGDGTGYHKEV